MALPRTQSPVTVQPDPGGVDPRGRQVRRVLWTVLALNLAVAGAKMLYGVMTHSLGMQADGFHSLFDGVSNVVGLVGLWLASAPPDLEHPYGHKKYETLAAAAIGTMLVGTCLYLLWNSYQHWHGARRTEVTGVSFGIMLATMAVNWGTMRWERRQGSVLKSEVLLADSQHTKSDILTSCSVLAGLAAVRIGYPRMDSVVAVLIALIIARTAVGILAEASRTLMDQARLDAEEVRAVAMADPDVLDCHEIRTRGAPSHVFVDLSVHVPGGMSVSEAHALAHRVEAAVKRRFREVAEVIVHVEPEHHDDDRGMEREAQT